MPNGVTVVDAAYVIPDGAGGFVPMAMKGQSPIAVGDGPIGAKTTTEMAGIPAVGPNIVGVTELPATAGGLHRGTIAGLYGDTGIFYATDPDTAYGSWQKFTGDWNAANPYLNKCGCAGLHRGQRQDDHQQQRRHGGAVQQVGRRAALRLGRQGHHLQHRRLAPIPIVDYGDGRGNAPWGFAAGTGGPQSGYAWNFDWDEWLASAKDKPAVQAAMGNDEIGPWQRIKYFGSRISKDQPGLDSTTIGYANVDAGGSGLRPDRRRPAVHRLPDRHHQPEGHPLGGGPAHAVPARVRLGEDQGRQRRRDRGPERLPRLSRATPSAATPAAPTTARITCGATTSRPRRPGTAVWPQASPPPRSSSRTATPSSTRSRSTTCRTSR